MCDSNNEVFDQIHAIAAHLFTDLAGDMSDEKKKRLRHGLNLIISLSGFMDNRVTQEDLATLGMASSTDHHSHGHEHPHNHDHSDEHHHSHEH
jgi:hypothetical protein